MAGTGETKNRRAVPTAAPISRCDHQQSLPLSRPQCSPLFNSQRRSKDTGVKACGGTAGERGPHARAPLLSHSLHRGHRGHPTAAGAGMRCLQWSFSSPCFSLCIWIDREERMTRMSGRKQNTTMRERESKTHHQENAKGRLETTAGVQTSLDVRNQGEMRAMECGGRRGRGEHRHGQTPTPTQHPGKKIKTWQRKGMGRQGRGGDGGGERSTKGGAADPGAGGGNPVQSKANQNFKPYLRCLTSGEPDLGERKEREKGKTKQKEEEKKEKGKETKKTRVIKISQRGGKAFAATI